MTKETKPAISLAFVLLMTFPVAILRAYVLVQLWGWFVVPLGAPAVGMAHAYGLSVLVLLATYQRSKQEEDSGGLENLVFGAFVVLILWGVGAVTHLIMVAP